MPARWSIPWVTLCRAKRSKPLSAPYSIVLPVASSIRSLNAPWRSMGNSISIEVVYAQAGAVWRVVVKMATGSTVEQALAASEFAERFPAYPQESLAVGIYGQVRKLNQVLVRSEEHTSELQSLMRISYAVFCLKKKTKQQEQLNNSTQ